MKTTVHLVRSVLDVDLQELSQAGVECALFDIEGTIAEWGGSVVHEQTRVHIERSGITKLGIVSNVHRTHADRAQRVATQIAASSCQYPATFMQRKPSAYMPRAAMQELGVLPDQTVFFGDKILDVLAARRAGVRTVYWVDKLGAPDQWYDTYVYRRVEPWLKRLFS